MVDRWTDGQWGGEVVTARFHETERELGTGKCRQVEFVKWVF